MTMNPSLPLVLLSATLFMATPGFARLGETPDQCDERYGSKYTETAGQGYWAAERKYEKGGVRITIRFLRDETGNRKAEYIEYKPINTTTNRMTASKAEGLLQHVSRDWTPLALITPPPVTQKPPPDPARTLGTMQSRKVLTIEKSTGEDKRKAEKEAKARQELLASIAAKNSQIQHLKDRISKITSVSATTIWRSPEAYAVENPSSLTIFSVAFLNAYDHQARIEKARKAKEDATPLTGF
jgi:hypothetical protein